MLDRHCFIPLFCSIALSLATSCSAPASPQDPDAGTTSHDQSVIPPERDIDADMMERPEACTTLFGRVSMRSGLSAEACQASCACGDQPWTPRRFDADQIASLLAWQLDNPPDALVDDPYAQADAPPQQAQGICVVVPTEGGRRYRLETVPDLERAPQGAWLTHEGSCGLCSSLADLAAYMSQEDMTQTVRQCGLDHAFDTAEDHIACLRDLGMTPPCAQIWYYNTLHTRQRCIGECVRDLNKPYHDQDGLLNSCLLCDERESGPVFKRVAGRTRRNSGLPSALCRPCDRVSRVDHLYIEGPKTD